MRDRQDGSSCLKIMGFRNLMRDRSYSHDRQAHQSVAPAHDRKHDGASFRRKAQTDYIRYVKNFATFLGRSPDTASAEDLRLFQQHMTKTHVSPGSSMPRRRAAVLFHAFARTERRYPGHPVLLGHPKLETTALYTRVAVNTIRDVTSPLERLGLNLAKIPMGSPAEPEAPA